MAKVDASLIIELSEAIHKNMRDYAQALYEKHGVMIDTVDFDWSMTVSGESRVMDVCVRTRTK